MPLEIRGAHFLIRSAQPVRGTRKGTSQNNHHSSRCLYTQSGIKNNVFSWRRKVVVDRSSFSCVGSVFHAGGAATEKALSLIRRRVRGTTRLPDDEARSADRAGTSATD